MPRRYDEIVEVEKFNPYHDRLGRFTGPGGGANGPVSFFTAYTKDPAKQHWADKSKLREQQRQIKVHEKKVADAKKEAENAMLYSDKKTMEAAQQKLKEAQAKLNEVMKPIPGLDPKAKLPAEKPKKYPNKTGDPDTIGGAKRGKPMEREQANSGNVNPDYGKVKGSTINCQSCVVAFEARLRGYDVKAKPNYNNPSAKTLSHATNRAWIDPATGKSPEIMRNDPAKVKNVIQARKWIEETVKPGERYTFQHGWKGHSSTGHIISVDRDSKGALRFYDPQTGKTYQGDDIKNYMSRTKVVSTIYGMKYGRAGLTRVDNMRINPEYADGIMEGKVK